MLPFALSSWHWPGVGHGVRRRAVTLALPWANPRSFADLARSSAPSRCRWWRWSCGPSSGRFGLLTNQVAAIVVLLVFTQFVEPLLRILLAQFDATEMMI